MSKYKKELKNMTWSFSRLSTFDQCKYQFYLDYIINDDDIYLSEGNFYSEVGSYVHDILEKIFNGKIKLEEAGEYFIEHYDDNVVYTVRQSTMNKTIEACTDYFAEVDFDWLKDYEILGVEKKVTFDIDGYPFIGFIDLLLKDKNSGRIIVVDHKSSIYPFTKAGKIKKAAESNFEKYKKQMYLYSKAVYDEYGEYPQTIMWNHFKDGGQLATIEFNEDDYKASLQWAVDTIHAIENEKDFEFHPEFHFCNTLCGFRHSCEYIEDIDWSNL